MLIGVEATELSGEADNEGGEPLDDHLNADCPASSNADEFPMN